MVLRDKLRRWSDIVEENPGTQFFDFFSEVLEQIEITTAEASLIFLLDYENARTDYTDGYISNVFDMVYQVNRKKYLALVAAVNAEYNPLYNVDATESYTDTRTPDLTTTTQSSGSSSGSVKNNQTRTTTDNPGNYAEITDSRRDPYDGSGLRTDQQTETHATGSRSTVESYAGEPDTTSSTSTGSGTTHATGSEVIEHELRRYGNIGVTSSQSLIEQELALAEKRNIFKIIEKDIAKKLFLQVW